MEVRKELWADILEIVNDVKEVKEGESIIDNIRCTGGEVILENSPVGESQSNGFIENAIEEVQNQIRKLKNQLELNVGEELKPDSPIWPWLVRYAGQTIHTFKIHRSDQRTSRQRIRSNASVPEIVKFGETVYFEPAKTVGS